MYFPQFTKLLPKKSKRCKNCKKFIVQVEDYSKKVNQKFELCHLFINQLPYCSINKIDFESKTVFLKFSMFEYKESKISFSESTDCKWYMILPDKKYEISDVTLDSGDFQISSFGDPFVASKTDRCITLKFKWIDKKENKKISEKEKSNTDIKEENQEDFNDEINWSEFLSENSKSDIILQNSKNNKEQQESKEKIILKFITTAEYLRLDYHQVSYEYEITLG